MPKSSELKIARQKKWIKIKSKRKIRPETGTRSTSKNKPFGIITEETETPEGKTKKCKKHERKSNASKNKRKRERMRTGGGGGRGSERRLKCNLFQVSRVKLDLLHCFGFPGI